MELFGTFFIDTHLCFFFIVIHIFILGFLTELLQCVKSFVVWDYHSFMTLSVLSKISLKRQNNINGNFYTQIQRGGGGGGGGRQGVSTPLKPKKSQAIGFLSNTGQDPRKNKTSKSAFNVGPSSARQRNAM